MGIAQTVLEILRTWGRQPSGELLRRLAVSRPSLMRAITELDGEVVSGGRARRTAYAARRSIRGNPTALVLYRIDASGRAHEAGLLEPIYPAGCAMRFTEACPWPLDDEMADGWFRSVPYLLGDMRPQGYLGRNFAHQFAAILQVDEDVQRWSEDDVLHALRVLGWDQPGNYILGEHALRRLLEEQQKGSHFIPDDMLDTEYPQRALQALNVGVVDSSLVAGEFPKFTARRFVNGQPTHVIVKFSGAERSPQEQRWADLLICEHLALTTIADTLQLSAAQSRIYQFAGRTFYEVERFDRHGEFGRSGVCTWHELNAALFGLPGPWSEGAETLLKEGYISAETAREINLLEHFGRLIANTDMHDGNLAFLPGLTLTPAYDMLPMLYAPQRGVELVERDFAPALPVPKERGVWVQAAEAALVFWRRAARDERISGAFRAICQANADQVERLLVAQRD
ncbi:type II toxin-antitoxin system HipA family toxin YjjJ [Herminiimonas contaminans]|uniref:Type II toxin-antitoxin system HipA family toxin YjjJ n=1 Tax=Herminiimonas contaminans TaxID=1111140 RepID=A0ABS0EY76_9BURK|nr:type II toxin-antitoxin system HipA family toxin YjjJ [Herminiimonas contaminans]MBF8179776.1 type II toxin-antitoxin system HipA family toxin YjjJ [Herminiimonas contaminans]